MLKILFLRGSLFAQVHLGVCDSARLIPHIGEEGQALGSTSAPMNTGTKASLDCRKKFVLMYFEIHTGGISSL